MLRVDINDNNILMRSANSATACAVLFIRSGREAALLIWLELQGCHLACATTYHTHGFANTPSLPFAQTTSECCIHQTNRSASFGNIRLATIAPCRLSEAVTCDTEAISDPVLQEEQTSDERY